MRKIIRVLEVSATNQLISQQAFFLNRLHPQWKPVQCSTGKLTDWAELYKKMQDRKDGHFETMVTIGKNKKAFTCRLIAVAVPEQVWAERIREGENKLKRRAAA